MNTKREQRKLEHLHLALETPCGPLSAGWEDLQLVHQALLAENLKDIDLSVNLFKKQLKLPIFINAMTGGAEGLAEFNRSLAEIAHEYGIGMAVGSQTAAIINEKLVDTFKIARKVNPDGLVFANISAAVKPELALTAVEMVEADALQLHLNGVQELSMAEGDRDFRGLAENIAQICHLIPVPIVIKEVGNGLAKEVVGCLIQSGVRGFDTGGSGGTNFAAIELLRAPRPHLDFLRSWGLPSAISLLEVMESVQASYKTDTINVFASGGITSSQHVLKALIVGADAVGIAGGFLRILQQRNGVISLQEHIEKLVEELKITMFLVGAKNIQDLKTVPIVITGFTREWCEERGIATSKFAQRKK